MFPALLMAKEGYGIPDNVPANEFLNIQGDKISTSRDYAVWLEDYLDSFPPDPLRYCLASIAPETKDSDFSWKDFQTRTNSELVGILGNFINRSLTFIDKHFDGRVPEQKQLDDLDKWILKRIAEVPEKVGAQLERFEVRQALKAFMDVARDANKYINDKEPWRTVREDPNKCRTTLNICAQVSKALAILMEPFLPFSAEKLWRLLNQDGDVHRQNWFDAGKEFIPAAHQLGKPAILISKIEDNVIEAEVEKLKAKSPPGGEGAKQMSEEKNNLITFDQFKNVDLRVAKVLSAERVENTDKLLRLEVEIGEEERQIVAGMAEFLTPESMIGKLVVVVANLQPAKIRGLESQGMLLAAENDSGELSLLTVDKEIGTGAKIR